MRRIKILVVLFAACLLAAACGGGSSGGGSSSSGGSSSNSTLTIDNESGSLWTCNFNPFNLSDIGYSLGPVYEPLMFVNTLQSGKVTPWLATAYNWTNGNKTLTFTIRSGVKWSDGKPMSAADVVYTFNLLKKYKALDLNAVWSVLSSVTQKGSDQVVMQFKQPAVTYFYYIADQIGIVPQHIWSTIADPVKYPDTNPVGTGAYVVKPCTPQNITYKANPHYYAGRPAQGEDHQLPGLHQQRHGQHLPGQRPGPVGQPVHPEHPEVLPGQEPELPLLVPAGGQRDAVHQPEEPDPEQRGRPAGHGLRDQPAAGVGDRRVRLRAAVQPDRDRHADVLQLGGHLAGRRSSATPTRTTRRTRSRS